VVYSSRHSDDALASKGLDLLRLPLVLLVAAPGPKGAVGGDDEAVLPSRRESDDPLPSQRLDLLGQQLLLLVAVAKLAPVSTAPDGAVDGEGEAVPCSRRHTDDAPPRQQLDLLGQQLALLVAVAKLAPVSTAPAPDSAVGGGGEAVGSSSRHSDDALASKGLDLLGQQLVLLVAVAQAAVASMAPAPESADGGDGETVRGSSRHSDGAPPREGLDLLRQQLGLPVAVAQRAKASLAPAPDSSVGGESEAVRVSSRHAHPASTRYGALTQRRREAGRRVEPRHALAVPEEPWDGFR